MMIYRVRIFGEQGTIFSFDRDTLEMVRNAMVAREIGCDEIEEIEL